MSSILKALEKAEDSSRPKRLAGDNDMIRARKSRPVWVMPLAVLAGASAATLITFAAMGGFSRHTSSAPSPVAATQTAPATALSSVAAPKAVPATAVAGKPQVGTPPDAPAQVVPVQDLQIAPPTERQPAKTARAAVQPSPKPIAKSAATTAAVKTKGTAVATKAAPTTAKVRPGTAALSKPAAALAAPKPAAVVPAAPAPQAAAATPAPAHPEPKVSGIAWQNSGESSFAVVNGRAVLQGAIIDGYKVLEIHRDRVRFSGSNGTFDVPVGDDEK